MTASCHTSVDTLINQRVLPSTQTPFVVEIVISFHLSVKDIYHLKLIQILLFPVIQVVPQPYIVALH